MIDKVKMPRKPKIAFIALLLITGWIVSQITFNLVHQLIDVPNTSDFRHLWLAIIRDLTTNHFFTEQMINGFIVYALATTVSYLSIQTIKQIRLKKLILDRREDDLTKEWNQRYSPTKKNIVIIQEPVFIALSYGICKPKILISTYALSKFSEDEIEAILYHEQYHCLAYHPLQINMLKLLSKVLFFIPVIKELSHFYYIWMEIMADRYAIYRMKNTAPIGRVLLGLVEDVRTTHKRFPISSHFANEAINYRMQQIIDPSNELNIPFLKRRSIIISISILITLTLFGFVCNQFGGLV
ncbi:M56 family metallopeptidase [Paenibacillus sp. MMO-177]|uniref:M56 family metallopeptidase n=1 Tax=Paenibacillus sp. MMO-177 TaxID=3081289 RepID=UPI0030193304